MKHRTQAILGLYILQMIYGIVQCLRAPLYSLILLLLCLLVSIFQIVLITKYSNLNVYAQMAINVMSIIAKQNDQFMVLQSFVGFVLFMQSQQQQKWFSNVFTCLIQVTLICIYSQNQRIESYFMSAFTIFFVTYFYWAIKQPELKQSRSSLELLPLQLPPSHRSVSVDDIHISTSNTIVLDLQQLEIRQVSNDIGSILFKGDITELNFLDEMKILKVDKLTQRNLNQKIKDISLRELIEKCLILQKTERILIIRTNLIKLEYFYIKMHFQKDHIIIYFDDVKEYAKYIKKNSCFALMNKLFQSFSHEFGTLLNQVALLAQNGMAQFPTMSITFDLIYNCCVIMNNMVKDLKDFHQLRSNTFQLEIVDLNIDGLFNELQTIFRQQANAKKVQLFLVNRVRISFKQDEQRIKQILSNLIQNAIKYTDNGGTIYVTAEKLDDKRVKFSCLDSGIGITEETGYNLKQMLANDLVLTTKISQGTAGLGLGLLNSNYLTKQLSSFQQQSKEYLQFSSKPGDGSNFWFVVWRYPVNESPQSQFQLENKSIKQIEKKVFYHQKTNNMPPPPSLLSNSKSCPSQFKRLSPRKFSYTKPAGQVFFPSPDITDDNNKVIEEESRAVEEDPQPNPLPNHRDRFPSFNSPPCVCCKLLLVDDEIANLEPLRFMIKILGYQSEIAQSGFQAITMIENRCNEHCQYRLILMDINMPKMDGIEATKRIKKQFPDITIVACSAYSDMQTQYEAQMAGMENYLEKPINKEHLKEILEMYL